MEQYIEEGLDKEDQTFARLCSGMIEELDAINRYQQRIGVEDDADVFEALGAAQREEMKHFAMQLELLLRRDEAFQIICGAILFQDGNVVELGSTAEKKVEAK